MAAIEEFDQVAILLAAGVGRRLGDLFQGPKALLEFNGKSLLQRSIEALYSHGVRRIAITIGFEAEAIINATDALIASNRFEGLVFTFVDNPGYRDGSLVSLHCQAQVLRQTKTVVLMDADVLYDGAMISRLLTSQSEGVLLVDREIEAGDEPVKICFDREGTIVDFRKIPANPHSWFGESVGFFRFSARIAADLADRCAWYVNQGLVKTEYEEAIRDLILMHSDRFSALDVTDLAWTEIDFPEDVIKARDTVLPLLVD